jgi:predicted nucleotidyltransferase
MNCCLFVTFICFLLYRQGQMYRYYGLAKKNWYSHGHVISSVVVIQLTLAVKQVLYISNPTLEFLTWMSKASLVAFLIFISVTNILNVSHNDNKA